MGWAAGNKYEEYDLRERRRSWACDVSQPEDIDSSQIFEDAPNVF